MFLWIKLNQLEENVLLILLLINIIFLIFLVGLVWSPMIF